jgi:hypothetical protein
MDESSCRDSGKTKDAHDDSSESGAKDCAQESCHHVDVASEVRPCLGDGTRVCVVPECNSGQVDTFMERADRELRSRS